MEICKYPQMDGKTFESAAITSNGNEIVLCGNVVKVFNSYKSRFTCTLCKLNNSTATVSHDNCRIFISSASSKGVTIAEYIREDSLFREAKRVLLKGTNTDGCSPHYDADDGYVIFCIDGKEIWRYTCNDMNCDLIYKVEYDDQKISLDFYDDKLLAVLNSYTNDHNGFDILSCDGFCLKSLRYSNEITTGDIIRGRFLNAHEVLMLYPQDFHLAYDACQIVTWLSTDCLEYKPVELNIDRSGKSLSAIHISPNRNFLVLVWMNMTKPWGYTVGVFELHTLKQLYKLSVNSYSDLTFSDNDRFLFLCADEYIKIKLIS